MTLTGNQVEKLVIAACGTDANAGERAAVVLCAAFDRLGSEPTDGWLQQVQKLVDRCAAQKVELELAWKDRDEARAQLADEKHMRVKMAMERNVAFEQRDHETKKAATLELHLGDRTKQLDAVLRERDDWKLSAQSAHAERDALQRRLGDAGTGSVI